MPVLQADLPVSSSPDSSMRSFGVGDMTEDQLQTAISQALQLLGYRCMSSTVRGWRGPRGYGATKGLPDLWISRDGWGCWLGMEVKGPKTPVSPEQDELAKVCLICIVRTLDEAFEAIVRFEDRLQLRGSPCIPGRRRPA